MLKKFEHILSRENASILSVMKIIDKSGMQVCLIVDAKKKLVASVTDGDIRRAILNDVNLEDPISSIMNTSPICIDESSIADSADIMKAHKINHLPIVDEAKNIIGLQLLTEISEIEENDNLVLIMAGGLGKRLGALTLETPKPMLPVGGRPLLESTILNFKKQGFRNFLLSVNFKKEVIQGHFNSGQEFGVTINYLEEKRKLGTAGALSLIKKNVKAPFVLINGDILTTLKFKNLINFHEENESDLTIGVREHTLEIPYGVVVSRGRVVSKIEEKPTKKVQINAGIYIISPSVLAFIPKDQTTDMPDLVNHIVKMGLKVTIFPVKEYWLDIGRMEDLKRANSDFIEMF